MMEWTTPLSFSLRAGKLAYDHRHKLQRCFTWIKVYFDIGSTQVVMTGVPGAGKTLLSGQMDEKGRGLYFDKPGESVNVEVTSLTLGNLSKVLRVLPGQMGYRTRGEIDAYQKNKGLEGVIHVVDFGYSSPRDAVLAQSLINDGFTTVEELRQRNLQLEIDALRHELANIRRLLVQSQNLKWLLIAVNKVDLYPDRVAQALSHYHPAGDSVFSTALRELQNEIGKNNLSIYIAQTCAKQTDFTWNGEVAKSSLPHDKQDDILREFMKTIAIIAEIHE